MITLKQVLEHMDSGQAFSLSVVSYDRKRKKGGKVLDYGEAKLVQAEGQEGNVSRALSKVEQLKQEKALPKDPHHSKWYTRNIRILQNGHPTSLIKKIHPPLILHFNNQKVLV